MNTIYRALGIVLLALTGGIGSMLLAQDNPAVQITYPPPVFVLSGEAEIVGTANAAGQQSFFVEYRPLNDDLEPREGTATRWLPATLPQPSPIVDGVLGVWDTTSAPDGLYEIRLVVDLAAGADLTSIVGPIRVDNTALEAFGILDEDESINNALLALTATAEARGGGNPFSTPVAAPGSSGTATPNRVTSGTSNSATTTAQVIVLSNLREGDSTLFAIKEGLSPGTELVVLGRSSRGTNWLLIETPDGERGWVAPSVVNLQGNILDVVEVDPPVPPITPTPTSPPVPELADAVIDRVRVDRDLEEGEAFQIIVDYSNAGRQFLPESALFCNIEPMNVSTAVIAGNLQPGTSGSAALTLRIDEDGGRDVTIICRIDMNEAIDEPDEANNFGRTTEFLDD